jgi:predicted acetyltransferase
LKQAIHYDSEIKKGLIVEKILLIRPTRDLKIQAIEFKNEFFQNGETEINGSELWDKMDNYEEWLDKISKNISKETVDPNWVTTDTFFAIRACDTRIIGIADFRHELNDFLKDFGHSGFSVRPSERKKGYATEILRQILEIAQQNGLKEIQLSCVHNNIPSIRTIIKNGGVYNRNFKYNEETANVYIIKL